MYVYLSTTDLNQAEIFITGESFWFSEKRVNISGNEFPLIPYHREKFNKEMESKEHEFNII
jgi:hypothetical protein